MKKLYIIFDQVPSPKSGGLVTTYKNLVNLLNDTYDIETVSIFNFDKSYKENFPNNNIHIINNFNIDNRFFKSLSYLKHFQILKFFKSIISCFIYFSSIKLNRKRLKKIIKENDLVIASCPSAAIFIPNNIKFILEIHTDYKYFFNGSIKGKLQTRLMKDPTLILYRTKYDVENAPKKYKSDYIYNFFDNKNSKVSNKLIKNKILYIGRLSPEKNPLRIVDIANELIKVNDNFIIDIYGTGPLEDKLRNYISSKKLEKFIKLKGFTNDKNIYSKYSLLWLTSTLEGFGLVIVEAKACGIPTISTKWRDSVYEVIDDKKDGFVTSSNKEFALKTNEILTNERVQRSLSSNALKNFNKFSKEQAKKKWINILNTYKNK